MDSEPDHRGFQTPRPNVATFWEPIVHHAPKNWALSYGQYRVKYWSVLHSSSQQWILLRNLCDPWLIYQPITNKLFPLLLSWGSYTFIHRCPILYTKKEMYNPCITMWQLLNEKPKKYKLIRTINVTLAYVLCILAYLNKHPTDADVTTFSQIEYSFHRSLRFRASRSATKCRDPVGMIGVNCIRF